MKVTNIYTYPIKSLRAFETASAEATRHGFAYDRRFALLKVIRDSEKSSTNSSPNGGVTYKNITVAYFPECVLFFPKINFPSEETQECDATITVDFRPPPGQQEAKSIDIPLIPDTGKLEELEVVMHRSQTKSFLMPQQYCEWFSDCLGYEAVLVYLGENRRGVRMSTDSRALSNGQNNSAANSSGGGFLSSMVNRASQMIMGTSGAEQPDEITFADCAPYLVVSEKSMDDVHSRLPNGEKMDITKFRPNIIVSGAGEQWEEDYWGEIIIGGENGAKIECAQNCARCQSINIDYATGKPGTGEAGKILKKLQSDRRVDPGMKYSPVFGRYGFLNASSEGHRISIGDEVVVSRTNTDRTRFDWDGICTK